jgi:hypothetical protein
MLFLAGLLLLVLAETNKAEDEVNANSFVVHIGKHEERSNSLRCRARRSGA